MTFICDNFIQYFLLTNSLIDTTILTNILTTIIINNQCIYANQFNGETVKLYANQPTKNK